MIRDKLIPLLEHTFSPSTFTILETDEPMVIFPAAHPKVGQIEIWDQTPEAIVFIEHITHSHFSSFMEGASPDEAEQDVAESVTDFLQSLFKGEYILWRANHGGAGGFYHVDYSDTRSSAEEGVEVFTWSGPI